VEEGKRGCGKERKKEVTRGRRRRERKRKRRMREYVEKDVAGPQAPTMEHCALMSSGYIWNCTLGEGGGEGG